MTKEEYDIKTNIKIGQEIFENLPNDIRPGWAGLVLSRFTLNFGLNKDTINRDVVWQEMTNDLERYIKDNKLASREFQEVYLDLFSIKINFLDSVVINQDVDSLKRRYPDNKGFFDFLKK